MHTAATAWACYSHTWPLAIPRGLRIGAGLCAICFGAGLYFAAVVAFQSLEWATGHGTTGLVTHGVYRLSRHPQYVGWILILVGFAMLCQSGLAIMLIGFLATGFVVVARFEERKLVTRFGEPYERWRSVTPAVLGWPRRQNQGHARAKN